MRVFLAGGTGAIGRPLVTRLLTGRHEVGVLARSARSAAVVADLGAEPVEGDALDAASLEHAVRAFRPEVVINQLTSLPKHLLNPWHGLHHASLTNQLRTAATEVLVAVAVDVGVERIISQSISFAQQPGEGVRDEHDPLHTDTSATHRKIVRAVEACEATTMAATGAESLVLRYGAFYGPATYFATDEAYPKMVERRLLPLIGEGRGIWALLHIHDAVDATIRAMKGPPGIYNICDDSPVAAAELIPWMAYALGAKAPRTMPRFLFGSGPATIFRYLIDEQPAVSSGRARNILGWQPRHPDWRHELARVLRGEPLV